MITGDISEMMVKSLIDIAADPSNKNAVSAFKEIRDLLGQNKTTLDKQEQKARIAAFKAKTVTSAPEEADTSYVDALKGLADKAWDDEE
nr:MAG TPA: hypothetical protein [Caudoviricetes sp.]